MQFLAAPAPQRSRRPRALRSLLLGPRDTPLPPANSQSGAAPLPWRLWRRKGGGSMAALVRLETRLSRLREEYFLKNRSVDEDRKIVYKAAVKIQSWFRGCRVRAYLRYLNKMAISIQKWWRGYQSRRYFRKMIKTAYFIMKMNFYNEMAVRIQKRWRGYYVRKYTHNYYALKKYLEAISLNNEIVRNELQEYAEMNEKKKKKKDLEKKEKEKKYKARKMHYLLSTEQIIHVEEVLILRKARTIPCHFVAKKFNIFLC